MMHQETHTWIGASNAQQRGILTDIINHGIHQMERVLFIPHVRDLNHNHAQDVRFGTGFPGPAEDIIVARNMIKKDAGSVIGSVSQECDPEQCAVMIDQSFFNRNRKRSGRYLDRFTRKSFVSDPPGSSLMLFEELRALPSGVGWFQVKGY